PFGAGQLVKVRDVLAGDPQPVLHPVVAGEVRGGLGGRDDVVGGERVLCVRQGDVANLGAFRLQPGNALLPQLLDLFGHAVHAVFARNADGEALDPALYSGGEVGDGHVDAG